jgi:hypothetical protein
LSDGIDVSHISDGSIGDTVNGSQIFINLVIFREVARDEIILEFVGIVRSRSGSELASSLGMESSRNREKALK